MTEDLGCSDGKGGQATFPSYFPWLSSRFHWKHRRVRSQQSTIYVDCWDL